MVNCSSYRKWWVCVCMCNTYMANNWINRKLFHVLFFIVGIAMSSPLSPTLMFLWTWPRSMFNSIPRFRPMSFPISWPRPTTAITRLRPAITAVSWAWSATWPGPWPSTTAMVKNKNNYKLIISQELSRSFAGFTLQLKGSVKELNKFHIYETEKITRKASDEAEYIELFGSFTRDRHAWRI